jgi:glycerophosphoryl diester phosphodiesterase
VITNNLDQIKVVAHRGGKFDEENTLANFKKALNFAQIHQDMNLMIECDVQSPKSNNDGSNGNLVLIHDSTVNRTTLGKGLVSSYTQDELLSLPIRKLNHERISIKQYKTSTPNGLPLLSISGADQRIPLLKEVLDITETVNINRLHNNIPLIGIGIDFTHVASRFERFKDHVLYPFLEKLNPGSQLNKVSPPTKLLEQLAFEISEKPRLSPIQLICQGVYSGRNLSLLIKLIEKINGQFHLAIQASTSHFPADTNSLKRSLDIGTENLSELIKSKRFTVNYNHKWDRRAFWFKHLARIFGLRITDLYSLLPKNIALSNKQAMSIASDQGFLTGFWTVNKSKHIEKAIKHGTNSITTDYPNKAIKVIRAIKAEQLIAMNPDIYRANLPVVAKSLTDQTIAPEPELVSGD